MRATLLVPAILAAVAAPAIARAEVEGVDLEVSAGFSHISGHAAGEDEAGDPLGLPFAQDAVDLRARFEVALENDRTVLGTPIVLWGGLTVGALVTDDVNGSENDHLTGPLRVAFQGGTMLPVVVRTDLLISLHASADLWIMRPTWATETMVLSLYGGAQATWTSGGELRARLRYDIAPFWLGTARVEHRATAVVGYGQWAAQATFALGQEQRLEGGYSDQAITLGVGWWL